MLSDQIQRVVSLGNDQFSSRVRRKVDFPIPSSHTIAMYWYSVDSRRLQNDSICFVRANIKKSYSVYYTK